MSFWWVNHSKSYKKELSGGYIWCPQVHAGDVQRVPWLNVAKVRPGDVIFSYAEQHVRAVGVARTHAFTTAAKPGYAEMGWGQEGWEVSIQWEQLPTGFSVKPYIDVVRPFLAAKHAPLKNNGDAQLAYLSSISDEFGTWLLHNVGVNETLLVGRAAELELNAMHIPETQRMCLHQARVGQGAYRRDVLLIEPKCRLTAISDPNFLIASHIKPWKDCSNEERLDGHNGLMLAPHVDRLFDRGWISFDSSGDLLVQPKAVETVRAWKLPEQMNVGIFSARKARYLEFHRDVVFGQRAKGSDSAFAV